MSATTAVSQSASGHLGVMVRTATELFVYWRAMSDTPGLMLRVSDLTGRPVAELLDGAGHRYLEVAAASYVPNLLSGHLYYVEVGRRDGEQFAPLLGAGPVQTPWVTAADEAAFPAPYSRS
ncbi:MAG TPA: hypothetical protein VK464_18025 [Symbiobacteriaceae bacterium]|jgi:hypothetical protein|nr:hypothetical protein [Symbiobacteriaceae bacterium]